MSLTDHSPRHSPRGRLGLMGVPTGVSPFCKTQSLSLDARYALGHTKYMFPRFYSLDSRRLTARTPPVPRFQGLTGWASKKRSNCEGTSPLRLMCPGEPPLGPCQATRRIKGHATPGVQY